VQLGEMECIKRA